jgi:hypothetical protein
LSEEGFQPNVTDVAAADTTTKPVGTNGGDVSTGGGGGALHALVRTGDHVASLKNDVFPAASTTTKPSA